MYLHRVAIAGLITHIASSHLSVMNFNYSGFKSWANCVLFGLVSWLLRLRFFLLMYIKHYKCYITIIIYKCQNRQTIENVLKS